MKRTYFTQVIENKYDGYSATQIETRLNNGWEIDRVECLGETRLFIFVKEEKDENQVCGYTAKRK